MSEEVLAVTHEEDPEPAATDPVVEGLSSQVVSSAEVGYGIDMICCLSF